MQIEPLSIPDILLLKLRSIKMSAGFFSETFRADILAAFGVEAIFVQDNHVQFGAKRCTPRFALSNTAACSRQAGAMLAWLQFSTSRLIFARGAATYGHHVSVELSAANWHELWVPPGFAHGYLTLEDDCEVIYKVTDYYAPDCDRGIAWDDPALKIDWRISAADVVVSDKDRKQPRLSDVSPVFQFTSRGRGCVFLSRVAPGLSGQRFVGILFQI